ncbi:unnamed protein product [Victoria cruziana]
MQSCVYVRRRCLPAYASTAVIFSLKLETISKTWVTNPTSYSVARNGWNLGAYVYSAMIGDVVAEGFYA